LGFDGIEDLGQGGIHVETRFHGIDAVSPGVSGQHDIAAIQTNLGDGQIDDRATDGQD